MKSRTLKTVALILVVALSSCRQTDSFYTNVLRSDVFYQSYSERDYDFLWVLDNSGSMKARREFVRDNMQTFLNIMNSRKAVNYQMAVVTTDYFSQNGDLVATAGGQEVVTNQSSDPVGDFAGLVNAVVDTPTSFWEQGLESSYQAVYKHKSKFSREGVPLVIIYITDEDDWSCKDDCYGVEPEHNTNWKQWETSRYVEYFKNVKKAENTDVFIFPIVGTDTTTCDIASTGDRYIKLADELGGISKSGSICNSKLSDSYQAIAKEIADRGLAFKLSSKSNGNGIKVYVDRKFVPYSPENYVFDEATNSIVFTGAAPKKNAIVEILYDEDAT